MQGNTTQVEQFQGQIKTPKGTKDYHPHQMVIRRRCIDTIVDVFKKHGAVQLDTPVFELRSILNGKYGEQSKLIYNLEDQGGQKTALRYDLTVPFARYMAMNTHIKNIKRFHIGKVYRRDQPVMTKGRYRQFYQCDFDIAGNYSLMMPDAQVISIMQENLEALDVNEFVVKVNHRKFLQCMIEQIGLKNQNVSVNSIYSSIDKLDKLSQKEVKEELLKKNLTDEQADHLLTLTRNKGDPFQVLNLIQKNQIFHKTAKTVEPIYEQMRLLFTYLQKMNKLAKVQFNLSLARGLDYYTGVIFEIVLKDKQIQIGSIAGGGRYDNLIGMFSKESIPAVGGSVGIERLFTIIEEREKKNSRQNECEVLVGSMGNVQNAQRLALLSRLWKANIKAETIHNDKVKPQKYLKHANQNRIPMILWLAEDELKKGEVLLKILYKREQHTLPLNDKLTDQLKKYIAEYYEDEKKGIVAIEEEKNK